MRDQSFFIARETSRRQQSINPLTPKISLVILLTVCHTILVMLVWRIGIGSINNPLLDILLYSHHFYAWYCIEILSWSLMGGKGLRGDYYRKLTIMNGGGGGKILSVLQSRTEDQVNFVVTQTKSSELHPPFSPDDQ